MRLGRGSVARFVQLNRGLAARFVQLNRGPVARFVRFNRSVPRFFATLFFLKKEPFESITLRIESDS